MLVGLKENQPSRAGESPLAVGAEVLTREIVWALGRGTLNPQEELRALLLALHPYLFGIKG